MHDNFLTQLQDEPVATVAEYYATCLAASSKAVTYLKSNALHCELKTVGFVDRTLGRHIPSKMVKLGRNIRVRLEQLGIYRSSGHEHFRGMVTVALHSTSGRVTGLYGRRIDRHGASPAEQHIGRGIFNAAALNQFDDLIIADTVLDAWTLYAAGHASVLCAVDYQLQIDDLKSIKRVLLCSDHLDCEAFSHCEVHRLALPEGITCHRYAIDHQDEIDPLAKLIHAASWHSSRRTGCQPVNPFPPVNPSLAVTPAIDRPQASALLPNNSPKVAEPEPSPNTPRATPVPIDLETISDETQATITIESRRWRIRGLDRNTTPGILKVNIMVFNDHTGCFHVDTFDLYHARSRRSFLAEAADEIGASEPQLRSDLGKVLLKLEELQHEQMTNSKKPAAIAVRLTEEEHTSALELLRDENLLDRILDDFETCGIVGERTGKLVGYLAATSRLQPKPLGLVIQSSSAAGKSSLADAILRFMPEESRFTCSAMTSQSLYYLGNQNLQHKILSIAEEEGVRDASYQLKLLQSEGSLSLISTSKEKGSGRTSTERYTVEGPVQLLLTTTATDVDPELMNRCLVVSVDESPSQTAAIHAQQRLARTFDGFRNRLAAANIAKLHQNAQRILKPLHVYNPFAEQLGFVGSQTRYRRDHEKYLTLIDTITLLHQFQREIKTSEVDGQRVEYLEVARQDIALANRIADWALGRSIDELPGPTRRLLIELHDWIRSKAMQQKISPTELTFTRRQVREALSWNATWLRNHLERLVLHEYVVPHGRGQGNLHRYSLLYDGRGREGQPSLLGLVDASSLTNPPNTPTATNLAPE